MEGGRREIKLEQGLLAGGRDRREIKLEPGV